MNALECLEKSIKRDRVSHAYLFIGERGVGKLKTALEFCKMLYCKEDKPCNNCLSCHQIDSLIHPNIMYISPDGQNIRKEQIDALNTEFAKTGLVEGKRIYIIDGADKMNVASANRLLKFIEEPTSSNTIGILISENFEKVLPTIVSRCQVFIFPSLSKNSVEASLLENGFNKELSHLIPYITSNYEEAVSFINENSIDEIINLIKEMGHNYISNKSMIITFNQGLNILFNEQENINIFMKLLIIYFMDAIYVKNGSVDIAFSSELESIQKMARANSIDSLTNVANILLDCSCKLSYNVNPVLLITRALLEIERG